MLAKITAKNQLTVPKSVTNAIGPVEYLEVEVEGGRIILTPGRIQRADAVRAKLAAGIAGRLFAFLHHDQNAGQADLHSQMPRSARCAVLTARAGRESGLSSNWRWRSAGAVRTVRLPDHHCKSFLECSVRGRRKTIMQPFR